MNSAAPPPSGTSVGSWIPLRPLTQHQSSKRQGLPSSRFLASTPGAAVISELLVPAQQEHSSKDLFRLCFVQGAKGRLGFLLHSPPSLSRVETQTTCEKS